MTLQILYSLEPGSVERHLFEQVASKIVQEDCTIHLKPLGRFGKTTAQVFSARLYNTRKKVYTVPYVVKLDTKDNIVREKENTDAVYHFFEIKPQIVADQTEQDLGILVFRSEGDQELKALMDERVNANGALSPDCEGVLGAIDIVLSSLPQSGNKKVPLLVSDAFKGYLRDQVGVEHIKSYASGVKRVPGTNGQLWEKLLQRIDKFLGLKLEFRRGPVHGDLHPSNVMVNSANNNQVGLIDFAWAVPDGITAIDYAMMENSVHYMWAPFWMPESFWKTIDEYTLAKPSIDNSLKNRCKKSFVGDALKEQWANTICDVATFIRSNAQKADVGVTELLAARTALLLGQAKFREYSPPIIGAQLWRLLDALDVR